jgi:hypothetical protein
MQFAKNNSKSFLLSPKHIIENPTRPSVLNSSVNTSFDMNCFSFNNEEGSQYYTYIGPDGQASSLMKMHDSNVIFFSPKNQEISSLIKQASKLGLLDNSIEF